MLTFTNKAAEELENRLCSIPKTARPVITTFHKYCYQFLQSHRKLLGTFRNFRIMSVDEQKKLLTDIIKTDEKATDKAVADIAAFKRKNPSFLFKPDANIVTVPIVEAYLNYQRDHALLDFDDLVNYTVFLLSSPSSLACRQFPRYILVDEAQDMSECEFQLVRILSQVHGNLFMVGDPNQAIYEWRGAKHDLFTDIDNHFPVVHRFTLAENRRSSPAIVDLSNHLVGGHNTAVGKSGPLVYMKGFPAAFEEARSIVASVKLSISKTMRYSDIAILGRNRSILKQIKTRLKRSRIPVADGNLTPFFERAEISRIISILNFISTFDDIAFLCLNEGLVPEENWIEFTAYKEVHELSYWRALKHMVSGGMIASDSARNLVNIINSIEQPKYTKPKNYLSGLLSKIIDYIGLKPTADIETLKKKVRSWDNQHGGDLPGLLADFALQEAEEAAPDYHADEVQVMTIHAAKGREFKKVFVCGLADGILPFDKATSATPLSEERRLLNVAITRAKSELILTYAENYFGKKRQPSRFLDDLKKSDKLFFAGPRS